MHMTPISIEFPNFLHGLYQSAEPSESYESRVQNVGNAPENAHIKFEQDLIIQLAIRAYIKSEPDRLDFPRYSTVQIQYCKIKVW